MSVDTSNKTSILVPPHNLEAERAVLGIMIMDQETIPLVSEKLHYDNFYSETHRIIVRSLVELYSKNVSIDLITLNDNLESAKMLDKIGGTTYLASLVDSLASTANLETYIKIITEKHELRKLINVCQGILKKAYDANEDVDILIESAESLIFKIAEHRVASEALESISPIMTKAVEILERLYRERDRFTGVASGFDDLDEKTYGFQKGELIIIAARPGVGKTTLALNMADHAGVILGKKVSFFSLEMSKQELAMRLICARSRIPMQLVRKGRFPQNQWPQLLDSIARLNEAKIFIDDSATISPMQIRQKCRRLKASLSGQLDLIVVDYVQLLRSSSASKREDSRANEVAAISREMKALAREMECPVIILSQLNRKPADRHSKKPMLSDLRDSGALEQDADVVIFIHREDYYEEAQIEEGVDVSSDQGDNDSDSTAAEIIIAKQRNGPTGSIKLTFQKAYQRFDNYTSIEGYGQ